MNKITGSILVATLIVFGGCASKSKIEKVSQSKSHFDDAVYEGQNFYEADGSHNGTQYRVFHQASTGFSGTGGIRRSAENRAKSFCKKLGKNKTMFKLSEHTAKPPYILGNFPRIEIIFVCEDKVKNANSTNIQSDKYEQLSKIKKLYNDKVLTREEFLSEKKKILEN
jgi:hypothetical protein